VYVDAARTEPGDHCFPISFCTAVVTDVVAQHRQARHDPVIMRILLRRF
jgi:hypothetical protein